MLHCQSRRARVVERKGTVNGFDHIFSRIVQQDCAGQGGQQGTAFLFTEIADDQAGFHIRFPRGRKHSRELFVIAVGDTYDAFVTFRGEQTHSDRVSSEWNRPIPSLPSPAMIWTGRE